MYQYVALAIFCMLRGANAQVTAQANVAPDLRECYTNPILLDRNNLPPPSIQTLVDIIQKIEDHPNVNVDLRMLAVLLLHTYRQDGIEYHAPESGTTSSSVLPFAPTFHAFYRHRLLLTKLIPNNHQALPNDTLPSTLKCALHHMLSTSVDARVRGDENTCGQNAEYRALRTPRAAGVADDVEVFVPVPSIEDTEYGQMRQFNPDAEVQFNVNSSPMRSARQLLGESTCPILDGVIHTSWGATSAGNVIAGIAAGAELQTVSLSDLTKGSVSTYENVQQTVQNLYPATLTGDLAEAVLIQGTRARTEITVGSSGNFNSSQARRFFMLSSRQNVEMTDPEIRGDIDGFILGNRMNNILQTFSTLKLSQLLDMYYSPRNGVFDASVRACNRRDLTTAILSDNALVTQTESFAAALNANMLLSGTITTGLTTLVTSAIRNFQSYTQSNMNDLTCSITESSSDIRYRTNLYIVLDATWPYATIYPAISYLVDSIEVGKFGSSVTLLSAFDGSVVVNKTFSPSDFYSEYTLLKHQSMMSGVNLETAYTNIRNIMQWSLQNETASNYVGGNSSVLLFLLNSGSIQNNQATFEQARQLNESVPDLRVLFATSTNQFDNLWNLVRDMHDDIHVISLTSTGVNVANILASVTNRILQANRRIINPLCNFEFNAGSSGIKQFDDFIDPGYIQFYAVSPNYFFGDNGNSKIRISRSTAGAGTLTVCYSRTIVQPRRNGTIIGVDDNLITCSDLASSSNVEINLQGACDGYSTIGSCPPMYISIQAVASTTSNAVCTDTRLCRFPYNLRYTVQIEDLQCFSSASSIGASVVAMIVAVFLMF
ncbi:uncharacterized protein LOC128678444 [Plodia interpunctella]|uniref:uncharacterized protein LOC128678444 n=1 Tax=Plodia interpunctella TaxID=58824 RepID=UPI002368BF29|nr:uncharacterized protein LOC128678444 [Plodia interpunctella]